MINIYRYSVSRNKFNIKGKLPKELKRQILQEKGNFCYLCGNQFSENFLELEHKIPVMLGGHLFNKENLGLVCKKCHPKKTVIDKKIIKRLKDLKIIWGDYQMYSIYSLKKLEEIYLLLKQGVSSFEIYWNGTNKIDYQEIFQDLNRV